MPGELILVVDDEENIIQLARLYLERDGFRVAAARDGGAALESIERFYQTDRARRGGPKRGFGLGLAIAHEIVQAHGGSLRAYNNTDQNRGTQGSVFMVKLPVARPDDSTLARKRSA